MVDVGLLVDISEPGASDKRRSLGPLNLRRGRLSLASCHPKPLEEEDDPFGLLEKAKENRMGAPSGSVDDQTQVGTLISIDRPSASATPSPCLHDDVFSPSQGSHASDEPNWEQLQSDAQSVASSCSEQPSLSSFPSVSSSLGPTFTPSSQLKAELDSPLALLNLSKEDSGCAFLVTLTPDKPPTASLVDQMSGLMLVKAEDEDELIASAKQPDTDESEVITNNLLFRKASEQGIQENAKLEEDPKTPKNKQSEVKALQRRLSAIKENRDPVKPTAKTNGSETSQTRRRSLASVQPRQGLGSVNVRHKGGASSNEVNRTGSSKMFQNKSVNLNTSTSKEGSSTHNFLKKKNGTKPSAPAQPTQPKTVKSSSIETKGPPSKTTSLTNVSVPSEPDLASPGLSPSVSESGVYEMPSSPLDPPQASSSTPSRRSQVLVDVNTGSRTGSKMPSLKSQATSRIGQLGNMKPRVLTGKAPSNPTPKPLKPAAPSVKPRDSLNTSAHVVRTTTSVKKNIANSLNTTGPISALSRTSPKKTSTPKLKPPTSSKLGPPSSGLRPPGSALRPPSAGLKPPSTGLPHQSITSTPKMRPPSALRPPSTSISRQGVGSTPQSRIRSALPSPQVALPSAHSTPRRSLHTPAREPQ